MGCVHSEAAAPRTFRAGRKNQGETSDNGWVAPTTRLQKEGVHKCFSQTQPYGSMNSSASTTDCAETCIPRLPSEPSVMSTWSLAKSVAESKTIGGMPLLEQVPTNFRSTNFSFDRHASDVCGTFGWSLHLDSLGFGAQRLLSPPLRDAVVRRLGLQGRVSAQHVLQLDAADFADRCVDTEARFFAYSSPAITEDDLCVPMEAVNMPEVAFLAFGGIIYYNHKHAVVDVHAFMPTLGRGAKAGTLKKWRPEWRSKLPLHNWVPVNVPSLRRSGARYCAWISPGERLGADVLRHGGLAIIFHEPSEYDAESFSQNAVFEFMSEDTCSAGTCPVCVRPLVRSEHLGGPFTSGWSCKDMWSCQQAHTAHGKERWYCVHCCVNICDGCYEACGHPSQIPDPCGQRSCGGDTPDAKNRAAL